VIDGGGLPLLETAEVLPSGRAFETEPTGDVDGGVEMRALGLEIDRCLDGLPVEIATQHLRRASPFPAPLNDGARADSISGSGARRGTANPVQVADRGTHTLKGESRDELERAHAEPPAHSRATEAYASVTSHPGDVPVRRDDLSGHAQAVPGERWVDDPVR
jgi:hypothetical protein